MLAGSLSSFFRLDAKGNGESAGAGGELAEPAGPAASVTDAALHALASEVVALRYQVEVLAERLRGISPGVRPVEPTPGDDTSP